MRYGIMPRASTATLASFIEPWYNTSWGKRQKITITASEALTDFATQLNITYDADMQADFDDLRFTSSDKKTLLYAWLEKKTDSTSARVWVKIPSLINGDTIIYMYYKNAAAASNWDGANTFVYFNDFDGAVHSVPAGWTSWFSTMQQDGTTYIENNGGTWGGIQRDTTQANPVTYRMKIRTPAEHYGALEAMKNNNTENPMYQVRVDGGGQISLHYHDAGWTQLDITAAGFYTANDWAIVELKYKVGDLDAYVECNANTDTLVSADSSLNQATHIAFLASANDTAINCDWAIVRGYTTTEPSATYGAEESL